MRSSLATNAFKQALRTGQVVVGFWSSLCSNLGVEILAEAGYDWLLLDMEHAPNEMPMLVEQLQAMRGAAATPVVRPPWNDSVLIKRILDAGAQSLLIPYVQTAGEAREAVAATRYPPEGIRGVASVHRANRFGRITDYFQRANAEMCVIVQVETRLSLQNLSSIAAVEGVDALFIGPSDLAASLGHIGNPRHPEVQKVIEAAGRQIRAAGKAAGILAPAEEDALHWLNEGFSLVAVGGDAAMLAQQSEQLLLRTRQRIATLTSLRRHGD
jgi:4-hydroxy-2-oxoheptanedioate aldolase